MIYLISYTLIIANLALTFSLNNIVFLSGFLCIITIFAFLLLLYNYIFITLFLLIAYISIILILFLVNGLLTMHSLSLKYTAANYFSLLFNYSLPSSILCCALMNNAGYFTFASAMNVARAVYFKALFIYVYFLNLITYFDFLMIYVSNFNIITTKMNALGTIVYSASLFIIIVLLFFVIIISVNLLFY